MTIPFLPRTFSKEGAGRSRQQVAGRDWETASHWCWVSWSMPYSPWISSSRHNYIWNIFPSSVYATITANQRLLFTPNRYYHQSSYSSPISIRLPRPPNRHRVPPGQYTDRYIHPVFATQQTAPSYFTTTTMSQNSATLTVVTSLETAIQLSKKIDILLERDAFALRLLLPLSDMTTKATH